MRDINRFFRLLNIGVLKVCFNKPMVSLQIFPCQLSYELWEMRIFFYEP